MPPRRTVPSATSARPRLRAAGAAVALGVVPALLLGACSDDPADDGRGTPSTTTTADVETASPGPPSETATSERPGIDLATPVRLRDLGLGLDATIAASSVPRSDSVLVAERTGRIHEVVLEGDTATVVDGPLLDLRERVDNTRSERGLLGLAVSPDGTTLVVSFTEGRDGTSRIERYDLAGEPGALSVDGASRRPLLSVEQPHANHNGGHVAYGPDGLLYVGLGDGGLGGDPEGNGQDPTTLLGKILRIDPADPGGVPPDNPFAGRSEEARPEIWLTGVRNPWRFSFDRGNGDLWVADVGQNALEEVNHLAAADGGGRGANLGWDLYEGTEEFDDADPAPAPWSDGPFVEPAFTYGRDAGCAVTGGVVYRGEAIPSLVGAYLLADYCGAGVRGIVPGTAGSEMVELRGAELDDVVSFAEDPSGEVLVLSLSRGVFRLEPAQ